MPDDHVSGGVLGGAVTEAEPERPIKEGEEKEMDVHKLRFRQEGH